MRQELLNPKLCIYTDGSGYHKWDKGSWAWSAYLPVLDKDPVAVQYGHSDDNKSGRAELQAFQAALTWLENIQHSFEGFTAHFYMDAEYIVKALRWGWLNTWRGNNWVRTGEEGDVRNVDLWKDIAERLDRFKTHGVVALDFDHVNGHADCMGNELADKLCLYARSRDRQGTELPPEMSGIFGYKPHNVRAL
jgi:ribonuclease HI